MRKRLRGQFPKLRDKKDAVYVFLSLCSMCVSMTRVLQGADGLGPAGLCFFLRGSTGEGQRGQEQTVDTHYKLLLDSRKTNYHKLN